MKRIILVLSFVIGMLAIAGPPGTISYLKDEYESLDIFTVGKVSIMATKSLRKIQSANSQTLLSNSCDDLATGNVCEETVSVENTGNSTAFIRVEVWIPSNLLATETTIPDGGGDPVTSPLYFSLDTTSTGSEEWGVPTTRTETVASEVQNEPSTEYTVYRFTRANALGVNQTTGNVVFALTNHQIASTSVEPCNDLEGDCEESGSAISDLEDAGVKVYAQAIQAQGFQNVTEAFNNY